MLRPDDEPARICALCSKPVHPGMAATRAGETVVHARCLARETGLRALDLQDRAAEVLARAERARAHSEALLAGPEPFAVTGQVKAFDAVARRITIGVVECFLAPSVPLDGLAVGLSVSGVGCRIGIERIVTTLVIRPNAQR